jgi:epoxyqueuosine reductase
MSNILKSALKQTAANIGFSACGIAQPVLADEHIPRHCAHIASGFHADMAYLSRQPEARYDAGSLLPGCTSVIAVALGYYTNLPGWPGEGAAKVARYAWGQDYHRIMRGKLKQLGAWL